MSVSITPPPAAPQKKRGLGCFGCGCLILVLLVLLFGALVAGVSYLSYNKVVSITTATPASIPTLDGGDTLFQTARQKVADFNHDVKNHQAATLRLNGDEINTLIAHDSEMAGHHLRLFVTLSGDQSRIQGSIPMDRLAQGFFQGRYVNFDTSFGVNFNSDSKSLALDLHGLQVGGQAMPQNLLPTMQSEINSTLNVELQKNSDAREFLQQAKSIQISDGQIVIETQ